MESYEKARCAHAEFQASRQAALKEIDGQIEQLQSRRKEILSWGRVAGEPMKKRGRPKKEDRDVRLIAAHS